MHVCEPGMFMIKSYTVLAVTATLSCALCQFMHLRNDCASKHDQSINGTLANMSINLQAQYTLCSGEVAYKQTVVHRH